MPMASLMRVPSSNWSAGTVASGLMARKAGVSCSLLRRSTCTVGTVIPFSARKMRTRRGLGAVAQSKNFMGYRPLRSVGSKEWQGGTSGQVEFKPPKMRKILLGAQRHVHGGEMDVAPRALDRMRRAKAGRPAHGEKLIDRGDAKFGGARKIAHGTRPDRQ